MGFRFAAGWRAIARASTGAQARQNAIDAFTMAGSGSIATTNWSTSASPTGPACRASRPARSIGTVTADRGEPSPTAALFAFVLTFEEPQ